MTDYYLNEYTLGKALYMLVPAIVNIDGGCPHCIRSFIDETNSIFEMAGLGVKLKYDGDSDCPVSVIVFDDLVKGVSNEA